ncbi:hypothetical protein GOODEAATRI_016339 [Goodea atripinnis]|uniref:Uncharacterized protein n=1 Tax=Goodea atripinnis TaxID=208336 RepID=A0ABV0MIC0_9TELE
MSFGLRLPRLVGALDLPLFGSCFQHLYLDSLLPCTRLGLGLSLLWGSEAQWFAQRARPGHADGLNVHDVVCLLLQVP